MFPPTPPHPTRPIHVISKPSRARLKWDTVLVDEIRPRFETHDFRLPLTDYHSMRRAISRAGLYHCRHRLTQTAYIVRVLAEPLPPRTNLLDREYGRAYASKKSTRTPASRWLRMTDQLMRGETLEFTERKEVTTLRVKMRQHKPVGQYPAYLIEIEEKPAPKRWVVKAVFQLL